MKASKAEALSRNIWAELWKTEKLREFPINSSIVQSKLTSCVFQIGTALWDLQSLIFTLFSPPLLAGAIILIALKGACWFLKCLRPFHLTTLHVTAGNRAGNADKLRESSFSTSGPSVFKTASHIHFSKILWGKKRNQVNISSSLHSFKLA